MKELKNRTLYACDHCGKRYQTKRGCLYHEQYKCIKNPNNQHKCFENCKHLVRETKTETNYDYLGGEHEWSYNTFLCAITDEQMHTFRLSEKHNLYYVLNSVRMPLECDNYEFYTPF